METKLDKEYWEQRWHERQTGWDAGTPTPPICKFADSLEDKNASILIPGCGNAHEAEYLLEQGFTNVTLLDISETAVNAIKRKFSNYKINILCEDFFEHKGAYDYILEQTFFCAIPTIKRREYVLKTHSLLKEDGILAGVLFDKDFGNSDPPFSGSKEEYISLFNNHFELKILESCYNSINPRMGSEVFIKFKKIIEH